MLLKRGSRDEEYTLLDFENYIVKIVLIETYKENCLKGYYYLPVPWGKGLWKTLHFKLFRSRTWSSLFVRVSALIKVTEIE
jgi:hypothetical protein